MGLENSPLNILIFLSYTILAKSIKKGDSRMNTLFELGPKPFYLWIIGPWMRSIGVKRAHCVRYENFRRYQGLHVSSSGTSYWPLIAAVEQKLMRSFLVDPSHYVSKLAWNIWNCLCWFIIFITEIKVKSHGRFLPRILQSSFQDNRPL